MTQTAPAAHGPGGRAGGKVTAAMLLAVALALTAAGCSSAPHSAGSGDSAAGRAAAPSRTVVPAAPLPVSLVPLPSQLAVTGGPGYPITSATVLQAVGGAAAGQVAGELATLLRGTTGLALPVRDGAATGAGIVLRLVPAGTAGRAGGGYGAEGYGLVSGPDGVTVTASAGAGLFHGIQTLRQLLPARGDGTVPAVRITDRPRYPVRSAQLDVARHFFPVPVVEKFIDLMAEYKFNYLHLHLTDDQGWRIAIPGLPGLTGVGASTEVGGGRGGYYTDADYRAIVAYAAARYITVVPEVDLPAHVNAALTAYPSLACAGGPAPAPYTRIGGGFDNVCAGRQQTYTFIDRVVGTLAAMTPGPWIGIGGDEATTLDAADYAEVMTRASAIVRAHGKQPLAWEDAAAAGPGGPSVLAVWHPASQEAAQLRRQVVAAARRGVPVIMEPADHAYLDQKYNAATPLGLRWAGYVDTERSYDWNPDTDLPGLPSGSVAGIEAALWTETLATPQNLWTMLLPRLPALAEVGWSPQAARNWPSFARRLASQAPRWDAQGYTGWTHDAGVPWPAGA